MMSERVHESLQFMPGSQAFCASLAAPRMTDVQPARQAAPGGSAA